MSRALIGYSGFVGSNLRAQGDFDALFNSQNIEDIRGGEFETIVCAGAPAAMWIANSKPQEDRENIQRLLSALKSTKCERLVLISTIAVFSDSHGLDEFASIERQKLTPYGLHRLELEEQLAEFFPTTILRLPGLFGPGIKKNVIFDFLHDNNLDKIDSRGVYQYYNLEHLWTDIEKALEHWLPLLHLSSEPLSVAELAESCFARHFVNELPAAPAYYDFRSRYAELWFGRNGYLYDKSRVIAEIQQFVSAQTKGLDKR